MSSALGGEELQSWKIPAYFPFSAIVNLERNGAAFLWKLCLLFFVVQHVNLDCLKAARKFCNSITTEENIWEKKSRMTYYQFQNSNIIKNR